MLGQPGVTRSTMMGLTCLRWNGAFFASCDRRTGNLLVKLASTRVDDLDRIGPERPARVAHLEDELHHPPGPPGRRGDALGGVDLDQGHLVDLLVLLQRDAFERLEPAQAQVQGVAVGQFVVEGLVGLAPGGWIHAGWLLA